MTSHNGRTHKIGTIVNAHTLTKSSVLPADTVFIDAGSKWANPFRHGRDGTREEVVARYNMLLASNEDVLMDIDHLKGKNLACYCGDIDNLCHGHTLIYLASISYRERLDWAAKILAGNVLDGETMIAMVKQEMPLNLAIAV